MNNRRLFLKQAGLMSAGLLLMPHILSAKTNRQYGIQLFSFKDELHSDVKGVIEKIAKTGYKQVEPFGYSKATGFWGLSPEEFKNLLKKNGLTAPSGHYLLDSYFSSGDTSQLDEAIEAAKMLDQEYIVVPYLAGEFRKSLTAMNEVVNKINHAADRVSRAGLRMAYHNHDFEFEKVDGHRLMDLLLNNTNHEQLDFEMDIYWVIRSGEDPIKWLQAHPNRFKLIHIKDMDKGNPTLNTEIGTGSIDYKTILTKAHLEGVKYSIVEQENFKMDPFASIAQSIDYLMQL
jgi:sugar phosphate isomerase/epimerase